MNKDIVISQNQLRIAVVTLVGTALIAGTSLFKQFQQMEQIERIAVTVKDTDDLRAALRKPFEGTWNFEVSYTTFHSGKENAIATGIAVFTWTPSGGHYNVLLANRITKLGQPNIDIVTGYLTGTLMASAQGYPEAGAEIDAEYIGRTSSLQDDEPPPAPRIRFEHLAYKLTGLGQVDEFSCQFKVPGTEGFLTFRRR